MQLLRATKFFTTFYGDNMAEKQFFAKNCTAVVEGQNCLLRMELVAELDYDLFDSCKHEFDTFVLEDNYLSKKLTTFLRANPQLRNFKLSILAENDLHLRIGHLKLRNNQVLISSHT